MIVHPVARLVAELMPISILVAGEGEAAFAQSLVEAGAAASALGDPQAGAAASDLAVLLADPALSGERATRARVAALAAASDRLLYIPLQMTALEQAPTLGDLTAWFEVFAELGYQPVVDFDAGFLAQGAFLVDRSATAAESELGAFAERLSLGGALAASTHRVASLEAELASGGHALQGALDAAQAALASLQADHAALRVQAAQALSRAEAAEAAALRAQADLAAQNEGWEALRLWVRQAVSRSPAPRPGPPQRRGLFARLRGRAAVPPPAVEQEDASLLRCSPLFDAAWYIASNPTLAETASDPVLHYLAQDAAHGADPGPWFDTSAYLQEHPGLAAQGTNPLVHAIRASQAGADRR